VVGAGAGGPASPAPVSQTAFQILPLGSPGLKEYTVEIDGQVLRYRNSAPTWTPFVWPNASGAPGSRITAVTNEDKTIEIFNEPGRFSIDRLFDVAKKSKNAEGINELSWTKDGKTVSVQLRIVSAPGSPPSNTSQAPGRSPATTAASTPTGSLRGARLPALVTGADAPVSPAPPASGAAGTKVATTASGAAR
jgi:type VI secretion system protein ImpL